jgi:hypothetical protein
MLALHTQGDSALRSVSKPPVRQNGCLQYGDKFYNLIIAFLVRSQKHNLISYLLEKLCLKSHLPPQRAKLDALQ